MTEHLGPNATPPLCPAHRRPMRWTMWHGEHQWVCDLCENASKVETAVQSAAAKSARPWLCPERRCTPLLNLRDGDYKDITVQEAGHSFTCWGRMAEPVTFVYDGVDHTNDCNACHYTPLKGLIRWQENAGDWDALCTYYGHAAKLARAQEANDDA